MLCRYLIHWHPDFNVYRYCGHARICEFGVWTSPKSAEDLDLKRVTAMVHIEKTINFLGVRKIALALSISLIVLSIGSLAIKGLNMGLDFTGGTQLELGLEVPAGLNPERDVFSERGQDDRGAALA